MLLVRTTVQPSKIHGLGLFADEPIARGTVIWRFTPGFDLKFTEAQINGLPEKLRTYLKTYAWKSRKSQMYCFASDDARYFNHSDVPNSLSKYHDGEDECVTTAVEDIELGEEITDDYHTY
jgi:uncharacterized protein